MSEATDSDRIEEMFTGECDRPRIPDQTDEDGEECEGFHDIPADVERVSLHGTVVREVDSTLPPTAAEFDRVCDLLRYWNVLP